jgi:hypothetical protein
MSQILTISGITGGVPPLTFFICDENGNNCSYLGNSGGTYTASTFYTTATSLSIQMGAWLLKQLIVLLKHL